MMNTEWNNDGSVVDNAEDVHRAMRRISMAAVPSVVLETQDDDGDNNTDDDEHPTTTTTIPTFVAERMKRMLLSIREEESNRHYGISLGKKDDDDDDESILRERATAFATLSSVPPFSYLPEAERRNLVTDLELLQYKDGDVIVQQGRRDTHVYVTTHGRVMLVLLKNSALFDHHHITTTAATTLMHESFFKFLGYLDAPAVFGEYEAIFETPRTAQVVAGGNVTAYRLAGTRFLQLVQNHAAFKLKLAIGIKTKGLFQDIASFVTLVRRDALTDGSSSLIDLNGAILRTYRKICPAIHSRLHSSTLDMEGWTYAIRRLPDTVTSTYVYLLSNSIPMPFMHDHFPLGEISVPSAARRRLAFAVDRGKLLVIMRERFSDVLDFLSLLCCHVHESHKLRLKVNKPAALSVIHECLWCRPKRRNQGTATTRTTDDVVSSNSNHGHLLLDRRHVYSTAPIDDQRAALGKLPLTEDEIQGLQTLWPNDFLYRVWDIVAMHENIQVRGDFSASYIEASDRWAEHIRKVAIDLLQTTNHGDDDDDDRDICVSTDLTTHIISSNTTSVRNLLSPYIRTKAAVIRQWGIETHPEIETQEGLSEADKLCALCTAYMRAHPHTRQEQDDFDASCIKTLRHTELTGIQVELVDLDSLEEAYHKHDIDVDPYLAPFVGRQDDDDARTEASSRRRRLLVNIDYAFGKQAEQLISALCLLFGESIASVGVMGKAGGLVGKRGDIVVADFLLHQDGDEITVIDNTGVDRDALARLSNRKVWSGGVLTVLGTLLQDKRLLLYYKKLMGCVSLEMEGSYYARELMRFKKTKLLSQDISMRFLYYFSDTPLSADPTETLAKDLDLTEVIPPQYAVTRELLRLVFSG